MMKTLQQYGNGHLLGNNRSFGLIFSTQDRILQHRMKMFHHRKTDRLDNFARSKGVGFAALNLKAARFVVQENVFAWTLVRDDALHANSGFWRIVSAILRDSV